MSEEELKALEREVKRRRRIVGEWASQLHDLVEDRLPAGYTDLPALAQSAFDACKAWDEAQQALQAAQRRRTE